MKQNTEQLKLASFLIALFLVLSGCSGKSNSTTSSVSGNTSSGLVSDSSSGSSSSGKSNSSSSSAAKTGTSLSAVTVKTDSEDYYFNWKSNSYKTLDMSSGTQTITASGIYKITGTLKNGSLIVNVDKSSDDGTVYLVLYNVSISSSTSAPIYIKGAKKVVILLETGTTNTLYQGSGVTQNADGEPTAALFSKADLTVTGSGILNVTSDFNDGITSKDDLLITDGTIIVTAKSDAIVGKDLLAVEKGTITVTAGKDGMRSTNETDTGKGNIVIKGGTFNITAANDGLQAYSLLQIDGGTLTVTTHGGYTRVIKTNTNGGSTSSSNSTESYKGIKATQTIIITNGTITLSCVDDAIHSAGDITISGGTITIKSGDDAIHSDTNIVISGGTHTISNCYEGIEGKNVTFSGGKLTMTSSDDGFNINNNSGLLTISGGEIYLNAEGDGLDSNGSIKMTGGIVSVDGPTANDNGAIDYNSSFTMSGGTLLAAGSSGMADAPSTGTQSSMLMYFSSTQSVGTAIALKDSSGNTLASMTTRKTSSSIVISTPKMASGSSYTLYKNDTKVVTFTLSGTITYVNESGVTSKQGGMGGPGGGMGGPGRPGGPGGGR